MSGPNRSMAVKAQKAKTQKAEWVNAAIMRDAAFATPSRHADKLALVACLARQENTVEVAGIKVSRCDDVKARKASRKSIIATHW